MTNLLHLIFIELIMIVRRSQEWGPIQIGASLEDLTGFTYLRNVYVRSFFDISFVLFTLF
jgi:hypothetical protein